MRERRELESRSSVDVAVLGGGPAGAAAARLLAAWGYETVVVAGSSSTRPRLAESLPPSCRKPLAALGLLEAVESGGFLSTSGNTAAWAGEPMSAVEFEGGEAGWQVERGRFDEGLIEAASQAGAGVIRGMARVVSLAEDRGSGSSIHWRSAAGAGTLHANWVLDCSGRAGVLARRGFRVRQPGPATLALMGVWRVDGDGVLGDASHTLVESYMDGWAWSVPVADGRRHVAMMVDPQRSGLARGAGLEGIYRTELAKTTHHRRLLRGGEPAAAPWACTATPYASTRYGGPGFLLVGDAGSFLDPLSSFGVKKALASGWLAAIVVNTALRNTALEGHALALFQQRERAMHSHHTHLAATYYARAAEYHAHPFWTSRAEGARGAADGPAPSDSERILHHPGIPAALESLRRAARVALRPSADLRRQELPVVRGREVVLEEHLVCRTVAEGLRFVRGVELPGLVDLLRHNDQVPALYDAVQRAQNRNIELSDFLCALAVLVALGLVEEMNG